ncbi:MauE/DoxX family redox-associated membrane protein [Corynebacterium lubricantis]|uniref:MauE/DoxX family redox-associated membrane protein n=1 Tax=Corynebacterium lubricantis TaxID=541095 RepID=UPI00316ACB95
MTTTNEQHTTAESNPPGVKKSFLTKDRILDVIGAFCRFYLGYIWLSAGISKMGDHMNVTQTIEAYEIFTPAWSDLLARVIGPLEIVGGLLLIFGLFLRPSAKLSAVVLTLFIIGLASAWARGLEISCGCFNPDPNQETTNYLATILRDVAYFAMSLFIVYRPFKKFAIYP